MSHSSSDTEVEEIARDLERYIASHPAAADTVDGIARWWLARPVQPVLTRVEAALELLIRRAVLERRPLPDGNFVYVRAQPRPPRAPGN